MEVWREGVCTKRSPCLAATGASLARFSLTHDQRAFSQRSTAHKEYKDDTIERLGKKRSEGGDANRNLAYIATQRCRLSSPCLEFVHLPSRLEAGIPNGTPPGGKPPVQPPGLLRPPPRRCDSAGRTSHREPRAAGLTRRPERVTSRRRALLDAAGAPAPGRKGRGGAGLCRFSCVAGEINSVGKEIEPLDGGKGGRNAGCCRRVGKKVRRGPISLYIERRFARDRRQRRGFRNFALLSCERTKFCGVSSFFLRRPRSKATHA
ncbi:hypothetical protein MRX96_012443 [Rhipicephalus microplus]